MMTYESMERQSLLQIRLAEAIGKIQSEIDAIRAALEEDVVKGHVTQAQFDQIQPKIALLFAAIMTLNVAEVERLKVELKRDWPYSLSLNPRFLALATLFGVALIIVAAAIGLHVPTGMFLALAGCYLFIAAVGQLIAKYCGNQPTPESRIHSLVNNTAAEFLELNGCDTRPLSVFSSLYGLFGNRPVPPAAPQAAGLEVGAVAERLPEASSSTPLIPSI
ncbi:hypothetical protein BH10PSE19_BH10PSE19_18140 [soil metagenome]